MEVSALASTLYHVCYDEWYASALWQHSSESTLVQEKSLVWHHHTTKVAIGSTTGWFFSVRLGGIFGTENIEYLAFCLYPSRKRCTASFQEMCASLMSDLIRLDGIIHLGSFCDCDILAAICRLEFSVPKWYVALESSVTSVITWRPRQIHLKPLNIHIPCISCLNNMIKSWLIHGTYLTMSFTVDPSEQRQWQDSTSTSDFTPRARVKPAVTKPQQTKQNGNDVHPSWDFLCNGSCFISTPLHTIGDI